MKTLCNGLNSQFLKRLLGIDFSPIVPSTNLGSENTYSVGGSGVRFFGGPKCENVFTISSNRKHCAMVSTTSFRIDSSASISYIGWLGSENTYSSDRLKMLTKLRNNTAMSPFATPAGAPVTSNGLSFGPVTAILSRVGKRQTK